MDRAVLEAYGWHDLADATRCCFLLDYHDSMDGETLAATNPAATDNPHPSANNHPRRKRLPWRYRWPDEFRDEILARLLQLNAQRAQEEAAIGASADCDA